MHEGVPVTVGSGAERYTLLLVFEMSSFDQFQDSGSAFELEGHPSQLRSRDHFHELRISGFKTQREAEALAKTVQVAFMKLSATQGMAFWLAPIVPIDRKQLKANVEFRDSLARQHHPEWVRPNGSVTDGGVFPGQSYILPEHERIWEYPLLWGKPIRHLSMESLKNTVAEANRIRRPDNLLGNLRLQSATKFLNFANGEPNRETGFLLYATVLEILADEDGGEGVGKLVAECRRANGESYDQTEGRELYQIRSKLIHTGVARLNNRNLSQEQFLKRYKRISVLAPKAVIMRFGRISTT